MAAASVVFDPDVFLVVFLLPSPTIEVVVTEFRGEAMFELRWRGRRWGEFLGEEGDEFAGLRPIGGIFGLKFNDVRSGGEDGGVVALIVGGFLAIHFGDEDEWAGAIEILGGGAEFGLVRQSGVLGDAT